MFAVSVVRPIVTKSPDRQSVGLEPEQRPVDPPTLDAQTLDPSLEATGGLATPAEARHHAGRAATVGIKTGRLAGKSMNAAIVMLAWPVLCEALLNTTIGLVDTWLAAHISQSATDGVGAAAYVLWFFGLITMAIGVGATALISRAMGSGRGAVARAALGQAMLLALVGGVGSALLLGAAAAPLAALLSLRGEAAWDMKVYLWAYCVGVPFSTILFAGTACARGAGDTLRPLKAMIVVNVVNLAVAWALSRGLGLGVLGIGLGTATAHLAGAAMVVWFHFKGLCGIELLRRRLTLHRTTMYRLVRLGLPNFFETFGMWLVNFMVVLMVGWMSAAALAKNAATAVGDSGGLLGAHLWAIRIEALSFMPGFAMGIAAGALCGQYLGAGLPEHARRAAWRCAVVAMAIMGTMGVVLITLGGPIVGLLSEQPAHRAITPTLLLITGITQVPFALAIVFRSAMHGAGDVRAVMIMTWISQWGLRLPLAYVFSGVEVPLPGGGGLANPFPFNWGLPGLWIGLCTELSIRAAIFGWRFVGGRWLAARV